MISKSQNRRVGGERDEGLSMLYSNNTPPNCKEKFSQKIWREQPKPFCPFKGKNIIVWGSKNSDRKITSPFLRKIFVWKRSGYHAKKTILLGRCFISLYTHGLTPLRSQQMSLTLKTSLWTRDDSETFMGYYATCFAIF